MGYGLPPHLRVPPTEAKALVSVPPKASLRSKQGAFDRISRSRPRHFLSLPFGKKNLTVNPSRVFWGDSVWTMHFFLTPANVLENMEVRRDFWTMHSLEKRFQTASTVCGVCFRLQICAARAVSASHAAHFCEPFGYVDGRCRKCRQFRNTTRPGQVFGGPPTSWKTKPFLVENLRKQSSSWNLSQPFRAIFFQQKQEHEITNHPFSGIISGCRCPLKRRLRFLA